MNVLFLDYDGVVNNIMWNEDGTKSGYGSDNKVNDFQSVQWVSEFCQRYNYKIVVTSTWRRWPNYKECLINGGLRECVEILGCLNVSNESRGKLIRRWLLDHPETERFIIVDDDKDKDMPDDHLILVDDGFRYNDYKKAERLHVSLRRHD